MAFHIFFIGPIQLEYTVGKVKGYLVSIYVQVWSAIL